MSWLDTLLGRPELERADSGLGSIEAFIFQDMQERIAAFSMADALRMPPVARATDLITSVGSTMAPLEYLEGTANPVQPRFVRRPDPFRTRAQFIEQTLWEMIDHGEAWWILGKQDSDGYPSFAQVVPGEEIEATWDDRRFRPLVTWRGRDLVMGQDVIQVAINQRAGQLHGRSVLRESLPYLATVQAAEEFARVSYGAGGVPLTVLKAASKLTKDEADKLKASWAASRAQAAMTGEPAVLSMGVDAEFPTFDPGRMELTKARQYGATLVARLMGIPSALLLVELSGASVQYTNVEAALAGFVRTTLLPRWMAPIEAALSDLVPRTKSVRFDEGELLRADVSTRYKIYTQAIDAGMLDVTEARQAEGWPAQAPAPELGQAFDPTPRLETDPTTVPRSEVPTRV